MANFDEFIGGVKFMVSGGNVMVETDDSLEQLDIEDVFKLAEFAAAAHTALTGAEYVHTEYDKGEFVVKEGVPAVKKRHISDPAFNAAFDRLERDCE